MVRVVFVWPEEDLYEAWRYCVSYTITFSVHVTSSRDGSMIVNLLRICCRGSKRGDDVEKSVKLWLLAVYYYFVSRLIFK
jgi:hypothetical protein